ncbi:MAG: ATP citrate lyase citrate-binding domain-containing protein [Kiritimatiellia bacterium]|nr:ATP citrate lyase citrate-binding domain-containing protein [Kiritimatiellia bacterium]
MPVQITELTFLNQLARRFALPVPEHLGVEASRGDIRKALDKWGGKGIVKADVMAGGRGKAGAVKVVNDVQEAMHELKRMSAIEVKGKQARTSYLTKFIPAKMQIYTAITYDSRFLGPSLTVSLEGGVDIESVKSEKIKTIPVNVFQGLDAYQASGILTELGLQKNLISIMSRTLVSFWDMFISTGMRMAEVNPWRIGEDNKPYACDFKAVFDEANFKLKNEDLMLPEYPEAVSDFEEEMAKWNVSSHRGQAHVSELGGNSVLPILFGGGASTIITETLEIAGGSPIFLSDFGGNPPYERMYGTAERCFRHHLAKAKLLLILGGKANNTMIDVTFQAIADALVNYVETHGKIKIPVVVGRGGPRMVPGFLTMRETLETLRLPYVIFGPDTPLTLVAEYAAKLAQFVAKEKDDLQ